MRAHLEVAVHPFAERDVLADLDKVLAKLDRPLNIEGMRASPIRTRVARLRGILTSRGAAAPVTLAQASPTPKSSGETGRAAARAGEHRSEFTRAEIAKLTQLVADLRRAERGRQKTIAHQCAESASTSPTTFPIRAASRDPISTTSSNAERSPSLTNGAHRG
jgi:hypothetical protein